MGKKLTIQDIARLAGVSKATVSRVLNQKQNVDPATRERILKIMHEQGFVPSITASGLASGRARLIGALVPSLMWPFLPEILRAVGDVVGRTSYDLILYSVTDANHEKDQSDMIGRIVGSNLVAGLLAVYPGPLVEHLADLHSPDFPVVLIDDQGVPPPNIPWISVDNHVGAYTVTRHLIQLGHRRIAHIQGPLPYQVSHERYQGYCDALAEAGIAFDPALVLQGDFMPASGRACTAAFLTLPERPTAIFAGSDYMAYGAITAATQLGLRVPHDLAVVGFDDNPSSAHMTPALTTVRQPFYEMGQYAIELLLSLLETSRRSGEPDSSANGTGVTADPLRMKLPTTLVVRQSCGAPCQEEIAVKEVS